MSCCISEGGLSANSMDAAVGEVRGEPVEYADGKDDEMGDLNEGLGSSSQVCIRFRRELMLELFESWEWVAVPTSARRRIMYQDDVDRLGIWEFDECSLWKS